MKKKPILSIIVIFILFLGIIYKPILIKADSGFDSSWDSGSSGWSGSSDWGGSSSWGSSSSSGSISSGSNITFIIITLIIFTIIIMLFAEKKLKKFIIVLLALVPISFLLPNLSRFIIQILMIMIIPLLIIKKAKGNNLANINNLPIVLNSEEIHNILPDFNIEEFNKIVFNNYKAIQEAWMNFDLDKIKNLVSDEIYNMYSMQLDTLKIKGQKNMMENIKYIDNYISNISTDNGITTIQTILRVTCNDYVIDSNNKVVRGNKNRTLAYTYILTFTKYTKPKNITNCPNCGAKININSSGKCEYCNSNIINEEEKWIMTKKQMLAQR